MIGSINPYTLRKKLSCLIIISKNLFLVGIYKNKFQIYQLLFRELLFAF